MTHGVDPTFINRALLLEVRKNRIEEFDITVTSISDRRLPA